MRRRRGYLLALATGLSVALICLGLGLLAQSGMVPGLVGAKERILANSQSTLDAQARLALGVQGGTPVGLSVANSTTALSAPAGGPSSSLQIVDERLPAGFATFRALFGSTGLTGATGLPNLNDGDGPGYLAATQSGLGSRVYSMACSSAFPYAAYAPLGSVQLDSLATFSNPAFAATTNSTSTGLNPEVRALGAVNITAPVATGKVYSAQGPIAISGNALGFSGALPPDSFSGALDAQIRQALTALSADCYEKGGYLGGKFLAPETFLQILSKPLPSLTKVLSVQQACQFPFVPIPGIQEDEIVTVLLLHHPWPADFTGSATPQSQVDAMRDVASETKTVTDEISTAQKDLKQQKGLVASLQQQLSAPDLTVQARQDLTAQLKTAQDSVSNTTTTITGLQGQLPQLAERAGQLKQGFDLDADAIFASKLGSIPTNSYEDSTAGPGTGWAYAILGEQLGQAIFNAAKSGQPLSMINQLVPPVRLVHLGGCDPEWVFLENGLISKAVWNVPTGRTLQFSGPNGEAHTIFTVQGDIWLQKGSTLVINGDLNVQAPASWSELAEMNSPPQPVSATDPLYPTGRILLEEGAKLVVLGNLQVTGGTVGGGSIVTCSPLSQANPLNTAVLVTGDVNLAHGVASGVGFRDLLYAMGQGSEGARLADDVFGPLEDIVAPTAAKVIGPWDWRDPPYFAKFATTFVMFNFLDEIGIGFIPFPIPLPAENCEAMMMKYLSIAYAVELNLRLGENLYTMSWWWPFGRGVVPIMNKVPAEVISQAISQLHYGEAIGDALMVQLKQVITTIVPGIVEWVINETIVQAIAEIAQEAIPFDFAPCAPIGDDGPEEKTSILNELKKTAAEAFESAVYTLAKAALQQAAQSVRDTLAQQVLQQAGDDYLAREVAGILLYSGGQISIGTPGDPSQSLLSSGFFFATTGLQVSSQKIIGSLVCRAGDIRASGELLHYPWFYQTSLYNPQRIDSELTDMSQFEFQDPGSQSPVNIGLPFARFTAQGFR